MQLLAENYHFVAALLLAKHHVPYAEALSMRHETMQEHVRALDALGFLDDTQKKALAPFLSDQGS